MESQPTDALKGASAPLKVASASLKIAKHEIKATSAPSLRLPINDSDSSSVPLLTQRTQISPPIAYMRAIQRRGNTYMVKESFPPDDDPLECDSTDRMIHDLYTETLHLSASSNSRANIFKVLYVLATVFYIMAGVTVAILSIQGYETEITKYVVMVLGFLISGIQTLMSTFSVEKRGVLLKDLSIKLRKISRQIRTLQNSELRPKDKLKKLEEFYTEVDEFDLNMFDNSVTNSPPIKRASAPSTPADSSEDSSDKKRGSETKPKELIKRTHSDKPIIIEVPSRAVGSE